MGSLRNGGGEALVRDYAIALKNEKYDVKVLVARNFPDSSNEIALRNNNVPINSIETPIKNDRNFISKLFKRVFMCIRLIVYMNKERPDILHVHLTILHLLHLCYGFIPHNIKIIYTCHTVPEIYFGKYKKEFLAVKFFLKRGNFKLVALHEDAMRQINEIFGCSDTVCLHNMIDLERFRNPVVSRNSMREQLGIPEDAFVVGHIGRFVEVKNHDFLIKVFAAVANENPDAFLLMIGDGDLKAHIELKLKEKRLENKYLILSNRYDIPELDHTMDVCVFPSKYEGFLIAALEAQACGVKCVCSDNIPSAVFLNDNIYVLSLEDSIEKWKDAVLYNDMPSNISKRRLEDYDATVIIKKLEQIYKG